MNTRSLIAAALTLASLAAATTLAQAGSSDHGYFEQPQPFTSTVSRADIQREALAARLAGRIVDGDGTPELALAAPWVGKTRAQVVAETIEARRQGLIGVGDAHVQPTQAQLEQVRLAGLRALPMNLAAR